jgi:hypothetical protein
MCEAILKMKGYYGDNNFVWEYPNLGATNSTGFSAQGIPWRYESGGYSTSGYATQQVSGQIQNLMKLVLLREYYYIIVLKSQEGQLIKMTDFV